MFADRVRLPRGNVMRHLIGKQLQYEPGDRLFPPMWQLMQLLGGLFTSLTLTMDPYGDRNTDGKGLAGHISQTFETMFLIPLDGIVEHMASNQIPESIGFTVGEVPADMLRASYPEGYVSRGDFNETQDLCASLVFVSFYERYADFFENEWHRDLKKWPPTLNFARVVRNSVAHSGLLYFSNPKADAVKWRKLTYRPSDGRKKVVSEDIKAADFAYLMIDMAKVLDQIGAPIVD